MKAATLFLALSITLYILMVRSLPARFMKLAQSLSKALSSDANNSNYGIAKTDSDIAMAIGKLCIENPGVIDDLSSLVTKDKCTEGMKAYLKQYEDGVLSKLANEVNDGGQFINRLKKKFDADAANWVWNTDTTSLIF